MSRISIELVPRDREGLEADLKAVREHFPAVDTVNMPDLLKFPLRSWEGCRMARGKFPHAIPHIRAIDFDLRQFCPLIPLIEEYGFSEVLIIKGDKPQDMSKKVYPTSTVDMIRLFRQKLPRVKIHAGIDPYRSSIRDELEYVRQKQEAGADGFFTQPFFDLRLMEVYHDLLKGAEVFWGVSPVLSDRSHSYWEMKNNAVFPADFRPTLEWNREFAKRVLEFTRSRGANVYFMPIRVDLDEYLKGIID